MLLETLRNRDWLDVLTVVLSSTSVIALFIIYKQLITNGLLLRLNTSMARHNIFITLSDCLSDDAEKTMKMHIIDHFNSDVYLTRYENNDQAIKSYLIVKRKYLYILFSYRLEKYFPLNEKGIASIWCNELACYQEFRDVHESQNHYYGEYAEDIGKVISSVPFKGWMYQAHLTTPETKTAE